LALRECQVPPFESFAISSPSDVITLSKLSTTPLSRHKVVALYQLQNIIAGINLIKICIQRNMCEIRESERRSKAKWDSRLRMATAADGKLVFGTVPRDISKGRGRRSRLREVLSTDEIPEDWYSVYDRWGRPRRPVQW
jgi:hypothetical protein